MSNELTVQGVVTEICTPESGTSKAGKEWSNQIFAIETNDQYPKIVAFTLFGDKMDLLSKISVGMDVSVSFNPSSRKYNNKYYHDRNAWKIIAEQATQRSNIPEPPPPSEPTDNQGDADLPF